MRRRIYAARQSADDRDAAPRQVLRQLLRDAAAIFGGVAGAHDSDGDLVARLHRARDKEIGWRVGNAAQRDGIIGIVLQQQPDAVRLHGAARLFQIEPGVFPQPFHGGRSDAGRRQQFGVASCRDGREERLGIAPVSQHGPAPGRPAAPEKRGAARRFPIPESAARAVLRLEMRADRWP